jgi:hypothetical protein
MGEVHLKSDNVVYPDVGMTVYSMAVLLVLITGKKPSFCGRLKEFQVRFLPLGGIFRCQEEHFPLNALAIDEWYLQMNAVL